MKCQDSTYLDCTKTTFTGLLDVLKDTMILTSIIKILGFYMRKKSRLTCYLLYREGVWGHSEEQVSKPKFRQYPGAGGDTAAVPGSNGGPVHSDEPGEVALHAAMLMWDKVASVVKVGVKIFTVFCPHL